MTQPTSERVELSLEALEAILEQARTTRLSEEQYTQLKEVLNTLGRLTQELEKKRTSISRLRNLLFGPQTEKTADVLTRLQQLTPLFRSFRGSSTAKSLISKRGVEGLRV